jgi:phosphatidylinositol transfer protein SFH5
MSAETTSAAPNKTVLEGEESAPVTSSEATTGAPTSTTLQGEVSAVVPDSEEKKSSAEPPAVWSPTMSLKHRTDRV